MNIYRTDLAVELKELSNKNFKEISGISTSEEYIENLKISKVNIETQQASQQLGKSVGIYYTIDILDFKNFISMSKNEITFISQKISEFLNEFSFNQKQLVLVVGLGNREITPDSLGPRIISKIISTRHIKLDINLRDQFKKLRAVAAIAPGVLGQTGIEISEIIKSIVEKINPCAVVVIDALVSQNIDRLGSTIQISNSGISPGSGVMNKRKEISESFLGVPIISIGIPTVVDATTLVKNILYNNNFDSNIDFNKYNTEPLIVTPKEIDNIINHASEILSLIINKALQPNLSIDDIKILTS